jgi:hypothetical protein
MDHFYERNVSEIRSEYTTFLINIMTPFIYEGIRSVYQFALNAHKEFIEKGKHDPEIKSPGILKIFQLSLKEIPTLNNNAIETEANRIKSGSKCADWFDDLVRAVIKSNIILLIFANPKKRSEILKEEYHNKIEIKDFIHKCYIESARLIYNNPELFWHEFPPLEIKRNQREACELIKQAIHEAIRKVLPIKLILKEYLQNNYIDDFDIANKMSESQYMNIQSLVNRDLHGGPDQLGRVPINVGSVLESENDNLVGGNNEDYSSSSESESVENIYDDNDDSDYNVDNEDVSSSEGNSEDIIDDDYQDGGNEDASEFLDSIKEKLKSVEENIVEQPEPVVNLATQDNSNQQDKLSVTKTKDEPPKPKLDGIPKAELDDEIKELLKKSNTLTNFDAPKNKVSKREALLMKEIEDQIKPKGEEPDRKLFFEQYMK